MPTQVLSQRLPATPDQVWARVQHSGFIASYLGARLPAADLQPGRSLRGTDRHGAPLAVEVVDALAPCSLTLRLSSGGGHRGLRLAVAPCGSGSRLTLQHEADDPGVGAASRAPLAQRLAAAPAVLPSAPAFGSAAALDAARRFLADTATLVDELRGAMAPRQGYEPAADGGFSLVQHLWHLADVEAFGWTQRFERLLLETQPVLPGVDGDRLAVERRYHQRPWRAAAARFVRLRRRTLAALARCDPATLQRQVHFSGQPCTGAEMLAALLAHDQEHRVEMAALWPPDPPRRPAAAPAHPPAAPLPAPHAAPKGP